MKTNFIYDLLVDPVTREALKPDDTGMKVISGSGKSSWDIIEEVPRIVTGNTKLTGSSEVHNSQHSDFLYLEHYQTDAELFDYSEENESAATKHETRRVHESVCREIKGEKALILDAGCGNGWAAEMLIPKGHRVISMDISSKNPIDSVRKTTSPDHAGLIADVYNLPFREETFDYIIASEIMEHVPDPKLFIQCLLRVLKHDGRLIITTPYNEKIKYCLCVHCNRITPMHAHLHSFNEENIYSFLPDSSEIDKTTIFSNKYLARIRSHIVLKYFSFRVWNIFDRIFNSLFSNPMRFKITLLPKDFNILGNAETTQKH